jgi:hypothetical protein
MAVVIDIASLRTREEPVAEAVQDPLMEALMAQGYRAVEATVKPVAARVITLPDRRVNRRRRRRA